MNKCEKSEFDDHHPWFEHWNHSLLHGFLSCLETIVLTIRHRSALQTYAEIHYPFLTIWCVCLLVWECVCVPQIAVICFLPPDLWVSSAGSPGGKMLELTHCFHWGVHCKHTHTHVHKRDICESLGQSVIHCYAIIQCETPFTCRSRNSLYYSENENQLLRFYHLSKMIATCSHVSQLMNT